MSRYNILETVLGKDLINILLLVDMFFSGFLLNIYAQIPGILTFVGDLKGFTKLSLKFEDCLQVTAKNGYIINV
jgi:hypothetical protein